MGMSERIEIFPVGGNPDRKYYIHGDRFIKVDENIERGRNEAAMIMRVQGQHPAFPRIISFGKVAGKHEITMERIAGQTLESFVPSEYERGVIVAGMFGIAAALVLIGVVHGDINVSNLMFDGKKLSLVDWEMARQMRDGEEAYDMVAPPWGVVRTIAMMKCA